ncbi:hypothetical protein OIU78_021640, partial [Salix suchowensis]
MSAGQAKCAKIRHIVRLRQMLRHWRNKARMSANRIPSDVPSRTRGSLCRDYLQEICGASDVPEPPDLQEAPEILPRWCYKTLSLIFGPIQDPCFMLTRHS